MVFRVFFFFFPLCFDSMFLVLFDAFVCFLCFGLQVAVPSLGRSDRMMSKGVDESRGFSGFQGWKF